MRVCEKPNYARGRHFSRIGWIGAIGAGLFFWSDWIGAFGVGFGAPIAPIYPGILSGQKENLEMEEILNWKKSGINGINSAENEEIKQSTVVIVADIIDDSLKTAIHKGLNSAYYCIQRLLK